VIRFGKSAKELLAHKQDFFRENAELLAEGQRFAAIYTAQPRRTVCKCCCAALGKPSFTKQGIDYILCARCGHLNGANEDTTEFCAAVYTTVGGADYAKTYSAADRQAYVRRMRDIYLPKAEFLRDALGNGNDPARLSYADLGAGSGYFVAALRELGFARSTGFEVSAVQTALAEAMIGPGAVRRHDPEATVEIARTAAADVVSMIGVLEHVQDPRGVLSALHENRNVRYLFVSLPLFSPCVFFEMAFPGVFQRQLSAGHTHLYTRTSLEWTWREFGLEPVAEWWFGTDMVDLFRAVSVELDRKTAFAGISNMWRDLFAPAIDDLQMALDRRKLASEVHVVLRRSP
jgi:hypothetical protein